MFGCLKSPPPSLFKNVYIILILYVHKDDIYILQIDIYPTLA